MELLCWASLAVMLTGGLAFPGGNMTQLHTASHNLTGGAAVNASVDQETLATSPAYTPVLPGFKGRITQKGLDYARDIATEIALRQLSNLHIPDFQQVIAGFDVTMSNIVINDFPPPASNLVTIPGLGLRWTVYELNPDMQADYLAVFGIGFFKISRSGTINMRGNNISFDIKFEIGRTFDGKPYITVNDCQASGAILIFFDGGWSEVLNAAAGVAQRQIENLVMAQLCATARKQIEVNAAWAMQELSVTHTFEEVFELDFRLVKFPAFYEDALETFHKGEIALVTNGTSQPPPFSPPAIPHFPQHVEKMVYVYVTDYFINSGFYAAYTSGKLAYNVTPDTVPEAARPYMATSCTLSLCIGTLFPQLAEEYPDGEAMLRVYASGSPHIDFRDGDVIVEATANVEVSMYSDMENAMILTINVNLTARFAMAMQGQRLVFTIKEVIPVAEIGETSLETEGTDFFFDTIIRIGTQQFLVPKLAELGNEGIELPDLEGVSFVNPDVMVDPDVPNVLIISSDLQYTWDL